MNKNLPANAIACTDVRPGMAITRPFEAGTPVHTVTTVKWYGFDGVVVTDLARFRVNRAGTLRLA